MTDLECAAFIAGKFVGVQRAMWSSMWPLGHCAVSSLLLNPLLRARQPQNAWSVVVGNWEGRRHAWCETATGDIVDITFGQFSHDDWPLLVLPARAAAITGYFAEIILSPEQEDHYRHVIDRGAANGWGANCGIKTLFDELYPIA